MSARSEVRVLRLEGAEWRDGTGDTYQLTGHAAVFNRLSQDLGGFRELIEPGFFRPALRASPDVRLLINHDPTLVLARTASGTLGLAEDASGLAVRAQVARTSYADDLRLAMQRGDVDQMSFNFSVADGGDSWAVADDGTVVRTLRADGADGLYDVAVVTYPAYEQTDASMRAVGDASVALARARELGLIAEAPDESRRRAHRDIRGRLAARQAALIRAAGSRDG